LISGKRQSCELAATPEDRSESSRGASNESSVYSSMPAFGCSTHNKRNVSTALIRAPASCQQPQPRFRSTQDSRYGWMKVGGQVTRREDRRLDLRSFGAERWHRPVKSDTAYAAYLPHDGPDNTDIHDYCEEYQWRPVGDSNPCWCRERAITAGISERIRRSYTIVYQ